MKNLILLNVIFVSFMISCNTKKMTEVEYIDKFENINYPIVGYWFFTPDLLNDERYLKDMDDLAIHSPYDLIFLTPREGSDFYDTLKWKPVFQKLVDKASKYNIGIGLQTYLGRHESDKVVPITKNNGQAMIVENTLQLDSDGKGNLDASSKYVRYKNLSYHICSELLLAYAFEKCGEGVFKEGTLVDLKNKCIVNNNNGNRISIQINAGKEYAGKSLCIITAHYMNFGSCYSIYHSNTLNNLYKAYSMIPFSGTALDEFGNTRVSPKKEIRENEYMNEKIYSKGMSTIFREKYGISLEETLFSTWYVSEKDTTKKIVAINKYMDIMRNAPAKVEKEFYDISKCFFGLNTYVGFHNTYHNSLINDEVWATGANWWNIARDYGFTDEHLSLPFQMGVSYAYTKQPPIYNMFYSKDTLEFYNKVIHDLRFNIRTLYHAIHDLGRWGIDIQTPNFQSSVSKLEECTLLLNRFNPSKPQIDLLVVFGMEGLCNWFPDKIFRNEYNLNNSMDVEQKSMALWNAGFYNAVIPSDEIVAGKLKVREDGKISYNGNIFNGIVYINPQYLKEETILFLENYTNKGGKIMFDGTATIDFYGNNIEDRFKSILKKATSKYFSLDAAKELNCSSDTINDGCRMRDGSVVFTNLNSILNNTPTHFEVKINNDIYSGLYKGIAILKISDKNKLEKFAGNYISELKKNGKNILSLSNPSDIYVELKNDHYKILIKDKTKSTKIKM